MEKNAVPWRSFAYRYNENLRRPSVGKDGKIQRNVVTELGALCRHYNNN
jgi:hypothetical protein